jgi:hypothetical protein
VVSAAKFFDDVRENPDRFYIIHYSSQSLFDAEVGALSPRITSIVVRHFTSGQTVSFATHNGRGSNSCRRRPLAN